MDIIDNIVNKFTIYGYDYISYSSYKFMYNYNFIDSIKLSSTSIYSDNTSYLVEDCYPNYLNSDTTGYEYITNSINGNLDNFSNIMNTALNINNSSTSTFNVDNKIIDMSYIKDMKSSSYFTDDFIGVSISNGDLYKKIDSILVREDTIHLSTLSKLDKDIIFDKKIINTKYIINYNQEDFNSDVKIISFDQLSLYTDNRYIINISFNADLPMFPLNTNYSYRTIMFIPNLTGQYKIRTFDRYNNIQNTIGWSGYYSYLYVYPDANINTYTNIGSVTSSQYVYLTKGVPSKIISIYRSNMISNDNLIYDTALDITYEGEISSINLNECTLQFKTLNGDEIIIYEYNGATYNINEIRAKLTIQLLNSLTQLILINTKGHIFTDYEKYAINKFGSINFKFSSSIDGSNIVESNVSLQIRN